MEKGGFSAASSSSSSSLGTLHWVHNSREELKYVLSLGTDSINVPVFVIVVLLPEVQVL